MLYAKLTAMSNGAPVGLETVCDQVGSTCFAGKSDLIDHQDHENIVQSTTMLFTNIAELQNYMQTSGNNGQGQYCFIQFQI